MFSGAAPVTRLSRTTLRTLRPLHTTTALRNTPTHLNNILESEVAPSTAVKTVAEDGIYLADGRIVPSSCIFLDNKVFLWDVPQTLWEGWTDEHFKIFDVVVPKPGAWTQSSLCGSSCMACYGQRSYCLVPEAG